MGRLFRFVATILLLSQASALAAQTQIHVVQAGETLSQVALAAYGNPLYVKKSGSLARLLEANPQIRNPDFVREGTRIFLPDEVTPPRSPAAANNEVAENSAEDEEEDEDTAPLPSTKPVISPVSAVAEPDPVSHLGLGFGFEYFRVAATDLSTGGTATLLSDLSPSARFRWDLDWNERWSSHLGASYVAEKIQNATSATSTLANENGTRVEAELGVQRLWSPASRTDFSLGSQTRDFLHSPATTSIVVDRVQTPVARVSQELDLARVGTASGGLRVSADFDLGGRGPGYSTNPGWGADAALYLKHDLAKSNWQFRGELAGGTWKQSSALAQETETHLSMFFGVSKRFSE